MKLRPLITSRKDAAFTLVELVVVIVVIAILATIVTLGLNRFQQDARDAQRSTRISAVAESLEAYFDKNGEYPPCAALLANPTGTLSNVSAENFVAPNAPSGTTNSFTCANLPTTYNGTKYAYVGSNCSDGGCGGYTLQYQEEATNTINSIASRRSS